MNWNGDLCLRLNVYCMSAIVDHLTASLLLFLDWDSHGDIQWWNQEVLVGGGAWLICLVVCSCNLQRCATMMIEIVYAFFSTWKWQQKV
jgi:hypothetical protein